LCGFHFLYASNLNLFILEEKNRPFVKKVFNSYRIL
jgi:hypothetical protein